LLERAKPTLGVLVLPAPILQPARWKSSRGNLGGPRVCRIDCGIESYHVREGTGLEYEQAIRSQELATEVAVTSDGQATLRALRIE